jgi:hypothetical protein
MFLKNSLREHKAEVFNQIIVERSSAAKLLTKKIRKSSYQPDIVETEPLSKTPKRLVVSYPSFSSLWVQLGLSGDAITERPSRSVHLSLSLSVFTQWSETVNFY